MLALTLAAAPRPEALTLVMIGTRARPTHPGSLDPEYVVVRLTDEELFHCPYVLFDDAATIEASTCCFTR